MHTSRRGLWFLLVAALSAQANPLNELDYQGKILLNDLPYTGNGHFKFAITDFANTSNYWAHNGTASGEPTTHLTNVVFNGVFSTLLGAAPMTAINPAIFNSGADLYLRVWFSSTTSSFSALLPAQKIVSSAYAINSGQLGGWNAGQVQTNAVNAATNAITLAGDLTGLPHANSIAAGVIVDADVNAAAAIAGTKIVAGTTIARGTLQLATGTTGTTAIGTGHPFLNAFSSVNSISAAGPNSGFGIVGGPGLTVGAAGTNITLTLVGKALNNVIWVATNGTPAGPGTVESPYDTPQAGYDAAFAQFGTSAPSVVVIAGGSHPGLIMSNGSVHVLGLHRPQLKGLTVSGPSPSFVSGYQNVEGVVITGAPLTFSPPGSRVRFHNCRFTDGAVLNSAGAIFQNCRIEISAGAAVAIAAAPGTTAGFLGFYQTSIENRDAAFGAIEIGYAGMAAPSVQGLEVIGCEVVNAQGVTGPAIQDWTPFQFTVFPIKLFAHNYIKGPPPAAGPAYGPPAVADPAVVFPFPPGAGAFLGFYNNTIHGHVGTVIGGVAHPQWHANNTVYGVITYPAGPAVVGWLQAGAGMGADAYGNIQHEVTFPPVLPDLWND